MLTRVVVHAGLVDVVVMTWFAGGNAQPPDCCQLCSVNKPYRASRGNRVINWEVVKRHTWLGYFVEVSPVSHVRGWEWTLLAALDSTPGSRTISGDGHERAPSYKPGQLRRP